MIVSLLVCVGNSNSAQIERGAAGILISKVKLRSPDFSSLAGFESRVLGVLSKRTGTSTMIGAPPKPVANARIGPPLDGRKSPSRSKTLAGGRPQWKATSPVKLGNSPLDEVAALPTSSSSRSKGGGDSATTKVDRRASTMSGEGSSSMNTVNTANLEDDLSVADVAEMINEQVKGYLAGSTGKGQILLCL